MIHVSSKSSCGTNRWCYYVDLYPEFDIKFSTTTAITNDDDSSKTYFEIHAKSNGNNCVNPTISVIFEEIDFGTPSKEYFDIFDNSSTFIQRCTGTQDDGCNVWLTCVNNASLDVSQIANGNTYIITIVDSAELDALCTEYHDYSINAELTITCDPVPTLQPTGAPTSLNEYDFFYGTSCNAWSDNIGIRYDISFDECLEYCDYFRDDCVMVNYFRYFKTNKDSRCYAFDDVCTLKVDENEFSDTNRSIVGYAIFKEKCNDYPYDWRDKIDDTCIYYKTYNWCNNTEILQNKSKFDDLIDAKYGITAIESCCDCGGGERIFDQVGMSFDYVWMKIDDILCEFIPPDNSLNPQLGHRSWNNLFLYKLCIELASVEECQFVISDQVTVGLILCGYNESNYTIQNYTFIAEHVADIDAGNYSFYVNTFWFDIDQLYDSESTNVRLATYTECSNEILQNYNLTNHKRNGIHPCFLYDTQFTTIHPIINSSINTVYNEPISDDIVNYSLLLVILVAILVFCVLSFIILLILLSRNKKKEAIDQQERDKQMETQREMERYAKSIENNDNISHRPSAPMENEEEKETDQQLKNMDNTCILCCDNKANMFNYPCGHVTYCDHCSVNALNQDDRCPNCREQIQCKQIYTDGF